VDNFFFVNFYVTGFRARAAHFGRLTPRKIRTYDRGSDVDKYFLLDKLKRLLIIGCSTGASESEPSYKQSRAKRKKPSQAEIIEVSKRRINARAPELLQGCKCACVFFNSSAIFSFFILCRSRQRVPTRQVALQLIRPLLMNCWRCGSL